MESLKEMDIHIKNKLIMLRYPSYLFTFLCNDLVSF